MKKSAKLPIIDIGRYGGKQVAVVDGKIIAWGHTLTDVLEKARKIVPRRPLHEIKVISVPKSLMVVYYV